MTQAYNFLAGWQLFPEKCKFEEGIIPKSGQFLMEANASGEGLKISINWVSIENEAFASSYECLPDGNYHQLMASMPEHTIQAIFTGTSSLEINFKKEDAIYLTILHEILPNGYLKISRNGFTEKQIAYTNIEVYHKQMNILPYASSVGGVAIRPNKEGVIKHKALWAMEEQTNMQLDQIRQQIELLAKQAQEIQNRKELSLMIYDAKLGFKPQMGHTYHLYENRDGSHMLSLVSPKEWGSSGPFKQFISSVKLLADHTWVEVK